MRAVIQRVSEAKVSIRGKTIGSVGQGLLALIAVHREDREAVIEKMAEKILKLRIFSDSENKMNLSVKDVGGQILLISQFTLYSDPKKGNRPGFSDSADPKTANEFYQKLIQRLRAEIQVETGEFGGNMQVSLVNDGPVTIIIDL